VVSIYHRGIGLAFVALRRLITEALADTALSGFIRSHVGPIIVFVIT